MPYNIKGDLGTLRGARVFFGRRPPPSYLFYFLYVPWGVYLLVHLQSARGFFGIMQPAPFWDALAHNGLSLSPPDRAAVSVCVAKCGLCAALFAPLPGVCACVCAMFPGVGVAGVAGPRGVASWHVRRRPGTCAPRARTSCHAHTKPCAQSAHPC